MYVAFYIHLLKLVDDTISFIKGTPLRYVLVELVQGFTPDWTQVHIQRNECIAFSKSIEKVLHQNKTHVQ